jgi:hypothetical protein
MMKMKLIFRLWLLRRSRSILRDYGVRMNLPIGLRTEKNS